MEIQLLAVWHTLLRGNERGLGSLEHSSGSPENLQWFLRTRIPPVRKSKERITAMEGISLSKCEWLTMRFRVKGISNCKKRNQEALQPYYIIKEENIFWILKSGFQDNRKSVSFLGWFLKLKHRTKHWNKAATNITFSVSSAGKL